MWGSSCPSGNLAFSPEDKMFKQLSSPLGSALNLAADLVNDGPSLSLSTPWHLKQLFLLGEVFGRIGVDFRLGGKTTNSKRHWQKKVFRLNEYKCFIVSQ